VLLRLAPNVSCDAHVERELALDEIEQETADAGAKIVAQYSGSHPTGSSRLPHEVRSPRSLPHSAECDASGSPVVMSMPAPAMQRAVSPWVRRA
jgi:hypothetical protein